MDLSRQEYPALLRELQPPQAVAVLEDRVKLIGKVNNDIADFLTERRKVEEAYASGLRKLAGRNPLQGSSELGIFQTPWQSIISSTEALSQAHQVLAQKIETDVERPLREYHIKNREMQAITTIQGNLAAVARDVESARKKAERAQGGKISANKVAHAASDVEHANQQWDSQAPYVFEQLQALDESRVDHLRNVLTQFQTHEVELVSRNQVSTESCLNAILNVNTSDEISTFVARRAAEPPTILPRPKSRSASGQPTPAQSTPPLPRRRGSSSAADTSAAASRARPSSGPGAEEAPVPESSRRPFGGLKRLGTVIGRRKDKKGERPPSPEKRTRSNLNPLRRGQSSKDMQTIPSPDASTVNLPSVTPRPEPPVSQSNVVSTSQGAPRSPTERRRLDDQLNGDSITPAPKRTSSLPRTNGVSTNRELSSPDEIPPIPSLPKPVEERRDGDGFNVQPSANDAITLAQQEAAATNDNEAPQFKLDIRDEPIREEGDALSAMSNVANTLRSQGVTPRKASANRGRRDVRNTIFVPTPQAPESAIEGESSVPAPSPFAPKSGPLSPDALHSSDAHSIRSAHSLSSLMPVGLKHPEMNQPGLNASIVETVSAWFSDSQVTKAVVMGELALAYNARESSPATERESIRLENFPVLEKVAPNPSFITQAPSRSGEYSVNIAQIPRTSVAFKYQVHLEEATLNSHAPATLAPSWKIEPTQTSVILNYSFNPSFASPTGRSVSLKNAVILINVENAKAQSCMSKPSGIFYKDKAMIVWRLGDITLDGYAASPQKLLARFSTDTEAKPGNVEMRWEIDGEAASGLGSGLSLSLSAREEGGSDPFADEGHALSATMSWKEVPVTRKIISGKYIAI